VDLNREQSILRVERRYSGGELKEGGKTAGSVRAVPLRRVVMDAIEAIPPRIDTPILFPAARGGYMDIEKFRHREWTPALRSAGIPHRRDLRLSPFVRHLGNRGGCSALALGHDHGYLSRPARRHLARWLRRTDDQLRATLDAYDASFGHGLGTHEAVTGYADERT
jgi:hypothetical protein